MYQRETNIYVALHELNANGWSRATENFMNGLFGTIEPRDKARAEMWCSFKL